MHKDKSEREGYRFGRGIVGRAGKLTGAVWQVEYKGRLEGISIQREGAARSYRCTPQRALDVYAKTARRKDGGIRKAITALKPLVTQPPATNQLRTPPWLFLSSYNNSKKVALFVERELLMVEHGYDDV
jgi:hypothetical protein